MLFDDLFVRDFFDWFVPETEEVRKKREELRKVSAELREAKRKAIEEQERERKDIVPTSSLFSVSLPLHSEEAFRTAVEQIAKTHPDYEVKGASYNFDNGYYRSLNVVKKKQ